MIIVYINGKQYPDITCNIRYACGVSRNLFDRFTM